MNLSRLLLWVLTALVGVGAIYFWALHLAVEAMGFLLALLLCFAGVFFLRSGRS
jgi:hypothetical protein